MKLNHFLLSLPLLLVMSSCDPVEEGECQFKLCSTPSISIVDPETYENLIGVDKYIHPDSIFILNSRMDTMYHIISSSPTTGWNYISRFSPWQELYCFNQCLLDSSFVRTYFLYVGHQDWDTIGIHFEAQQPRYYITFNGENGAIPQDADYTTGFWFRKKISN